MKNTKARVKIEEEGIAIFGTNISKKKRNRERALWKGRYPDGWNRFASVLSRRCSRRKRVFLSIISTFFTRSLVLFPIASPRYFMNSLILAQCHRENTFSSVPTSYASIKMRGRDKGPPFLADTYFRRRRFRASFHPWYSSMNFLLRLLLVIWKRKNTEFILICINRIYVIFYSFFDFKNKYDIW